jgi:hypothetical protein
MNGEVKAEIVHVELIVYTREPNKTKPVARRAALDRAQAFSVLNFVRHRLHGGRLALLKLEHEREEKRIIVPP